MVRSERVALLIVLVQMTSGCGASETEPVTAQEDEPPRAEVLAAQLWGWADEEPPPVDGPHHLGPLRRQTPSQERRALCAHIGRAMSRERD